MTSRQTAAAGGVFGVLLAAGVMTQSTPDFDQSDRHWVAYFADSGKDARFIASGLLLCLAALAWVAFSTGLRERAGGGPVTAGLAVMAGALIGVAGVGTTLLGAVINGHAGYVTDAGTLRLASATGYATLAFLALPTAALSLGMTALAGRRAGTLPGALAMSGIAIAVLQLAAFFFLPMLAFALWALVAAVVLARRPLKIPLPA